MRGSASALWVAHASHRPLSHGPNRGHSQGEGCGRVRAACCHCTGTRNSDSDQLRPDQLRSAAAVVIAGSRKQQRAVSLGPSRQRSAPLYVTPGGRTAKQPHGVKKKKVVDVGTPREPTVRLTHCKGAYSSSKGAEPRMHQHVFAQEAGLPGRRFRTAAQTAGVQPAHGPRVHADECPAAPVPWDRLRSKRGQGCGEQ